jgi:hypothetical protein
MGNINDTLIILGSLRYQSAPDTDIGLKVPFVQTQKLITEYDRSANISLEQVFDDERQKSTLFRPVAKYTLIFQNAYSGYSTYEPFINNLYYLNAEEAAAKACLGDPVTWIGLPQYNEFDFIRNDFNQPYYTQPPDQHFIFRPKDVAKYNWSFCMTYPYENDTTQTMSAIFLIPGVAGKQSVSWIVSDGIPFVVKLTTQRGMKIIQLWSPIKHGVSVGEFVKFKSPFNLGGIDFFEVYSLGNDTVGSDEYVINIQDPGFTTVSTGLKSTFKRVILQNNQNETTSEYYVRRHRVLTEPTSPVLVNCGYEQNIFKTTAKYEREPYTPNQFGRISIKEGSQSYTLSFNTDANINNLVDNQGRPVTKLFYTTIWRGYFGWTKSLKQGWECNLPLDPLLSIPTTWWIDSNSSSNVNLTTSSYNVPPPLGINPLGAPFTFTYTNTPNVGDVLDGDLCEWNDYEQAEYEISTYYHKIRFDENIFTTSFGPSNNQFGYYYQPHFGVNLRDYSDYLEEAEPKNTVGIPDYAYFSENRNVFVWRDLYDYGYIDSDGIGTNWPFMNGRHHIYRNITFRIIPEGSNYSEYSFNNATTQLMVIDGCE